MKRGSRIFFTTGLVLATLLILVSVWLWQAQAIRLRWEETLSQLGVTHDPVRISGFPLSVRLSARHAALGLLSAEKMMLRISFLHTDRVSGNFQNLHLGSWRVAAASYVALTNKSPNGAIPFAIALSELKGETELSARFEGTGQLLGAPFLMDGPAPLHQWRNAGGAIEFSALHLLAPDVDLTGDATVTLDQEMRPLLAGSVRGKGVGVFLDRLQRALGAPAGIVISPQHEGLAALTVQDGFLFIDGVKGHPVPAVALP
ncbi:MAG TPA: DUF2125 domain-containing protein [Dongiaceae bacterium]|jgi:hypothetical protein|nr:DUF2125 domain-containing protein [Dongiaceae bacterium]